MVHFSVWYFYLFPSFYDRGKNSFNKWKEQCIPELAYVFVSFNYCFREFYSKTAIYRKSSLPLPPPPTPTPTPSIPEPEVLTQSCCGTIKRSHIKSELTCKVELGPTKFIVIVF